MSLRRACLVGWSVAVVVVAAAPGCDANHDALAKKDVTTSVGAGGAMVATAATSSTSGGGGDGGSSPVEPDVASEMIFVNGIVDASAMAFCFVPHPGGATDEVPWPSAAGLGFARAASLDPQTLVPAGGDDVEVRAIVGTAAAVGAKSCAQLEGAAGVRVVPLAILPSSALSAKRRVLVVSTGCVGGAGHDGPESELACGTGYAPDAPTAGLVAGYLSNLGDPAALRMQFVHAVAATTGTATLGLAVGDDDAQPSAIDGAWTYGAITPNPPFDSLALAELGELPKARLVVGNGGGTGDLPFERAFANGGVAAKAVKDGDHLAFVVVGARPGLATASWWRGLDAVALHDAK